MPGLFVISLNVKQLSLFGFKFLICDCSNIKQLFKFSYFIKIRGCSGTSGAFMDIIFNIFFYFKNQMILFFRESDGIFIFYSSGDAVSCISAADENNLQISSGKSGFFVLYTGNIIEIIGLLPDQSLINSISETTRLYRKKVIVNSYIEFSVAFQMYKNGITIRELFLLISFCE
nr:MAG TPA: hypothetical protein [Caudoviricetes sp.]